MAYRKYIKRGKKLYGPYVYKSKRVDGKVVTEYVGRGKEGEEGKETSKFKLLWFFLPFLAVLITLLLVFLLPTFPTGKVALEIAPSYKINETITGNLKLNVRHGELIPKDSIVVFKLNNQLKEVPISELVGIETEKGSFYVEDVDLEGLGEGYGFIGEKKVYPRISFELLVYTGEIEEEKKEAGENITEENVTEIGGAENITEVVNITEIPENITAPENITEIENITEEKPKEENITEPSGEETPEEKAGEKEEKKEGKENETGEAEIGAGAETGEQAGITGAAVENWRTIKGEVAYQQDFRHELSVGETAEIVKDSVKTEDKSLSLDELELEVKEREVKVSTEYYEIEEGFGEDYTTNDMESISISLEQFGLKAELGNLEISILYKNYTLLEVSKKLLVEGEEIPVPENITAPENITTNVTLIENITIENVTITTQQYQAVLGKPVKWNKNVKLEQTGIVKVQLPKSAENISVYKVVGEVSEELIETTQTTEPIPAPTEETAEQNQTLSPEETIPTEETTPTLPAEETATKEDKEKAEKEKEEEKIKEEVAEENVAITGMTISGKITADIELEKKPLLIRFFSKLFRAITGRAITTEEFEGIKEVTIDDTALEYDVGYETPSPESFEELTSTGKKIIISSSAELHYENVLAYTELPKEVSEDKVRLYWLNGTTRQEVNITKYDLNNNSLVDYVEWLVSSLSNQTYELVIEISKAEHLDSNRNFISDIYNETKAKDEVWSEAIYHNEYVRATFKINLTQGRDITVYVRNLQQERTKIEVYEKDGAEKLAEFPVITEEGYYKIYLTNLIGEQDTFDLKIVNLDNNPEAYLEFDYIVDPDTLAPYGWLKSPPKNATVQTNLTVYFAANFSDDTALKNTTLWVWNSTKNVVNNTENRTLTGTATNETNISIVLPRDDTYLWSFYTCDTSNNCEFAWNGTTGVNAYNFTLFVPCSSVYSNWTITTPFNLDKNITCDFINVTSTLNINNSQYDNATIKISANNISISDTTAGGNGLITATGTGYRGVDVFGIGLGPGGGSVLTAGGSYGGNATGNSNQSYGSLTHPIDIGSSGAGGDTSGDRSGAGGGAIWLNVTGTLLSDGGTDINAGGGGGTGTDVAGAGGSGGSILITARNITSRTASDLNVRVDGGGGGTGANPGAGGRIAVYHVLGTFVGVVWSGGTTERKNGSFMECVYLDGMTCQGNSLGKLITRNGSINLVTNFSLNKSVGLNRDIITYWNDTYVKWNDTHLVKDSPAIPQKVWYNLTGLLASTQYNITNNGTEISGSPLTTDSGGNLPLFNLTFEPSAGYTSEHEIIVQEQTGDTTAPFVFLKTPANGSTQINLTLWFQANFTDETGLKNATLILYNSTGDILNETENYTLSGTADIANLSLSPTFWKYNGTFYWNYRAYDTSNNVAFNDSNFTLLLETNPVSGCIDINQSGRYVMVADILNSDISYCINIRADNVTFDCAGHTVDGDDDRNTIRAVNITRATQRSTNITLKNCKLSDYSGNLHVERADGNIFTNITVFSSFQAINLINSNYNNFTDINTTSNTIWGIYISSSDYNIFKNVKSYSNPRGFYFLSDSDSNEIINATIVSNQYGIYLIGVTSTGNIITNSTIKSSTSRGIYMTGSSNLIYNNFFNNSNNYQAGNAGNNLNTTKSAVTNIVSGSNIGGNFWANPAGTGFSETCGDANADGICDSSYTLRNNNIDYLPLASGTGDSEIPYIVLGVPSNNTFVNGNVTLKIAASDNAGIKNVTVYYKNSTVSWTYLCSDTASPYNCVWDTISFGNETEGYDFNATAWDVNLLVNASIRHYVIDRKMPHVKDISITYPSGQTSARSKQNVTINVNTTDSALVAAGMSHVEINLTLLNSTEYANMTLVSGFLSTGNWSYWEINVSINGSTGTQYAYFKAYDNATPVRNERRGDSVEVIIDNDMPTYTSLGDSDSIYNNTQADFYVTAKDNYGLDNYIFSSNLTGTWVNDTKVGISGTAEAVTHSKIPTLEGNYSYLFIVYDDSGNSNVTEQGTIEVLGNAPGFSILLQYPPEGSIENTTTNLNFSYENGIANNCSLYVNGTLNSTLTSPANYTVLNFTLSFMNAWHSWYVECEEQGTTNIYSSDIRNFLVDTAYPQVSMVYPTNTTYNSLVSELNYTASDTNLDSCWYSTTNGRVNTSTTCGTNVTGLASSDGSNTWTAYANDSAGKLNSSSITFAQDTFKPIISNVNSTPSTTSATVEWMTDKLANSSVYYGTSSSTSSSTGSSSSVTLHLINFGGLTEATVYYFNVSSCDSVAHCNFSTQYTFTTLSSETRTGEVGGGGGGGGGEACRENWECGAWSGCIAGLKRRGCTDLNNCEREIFKPETQISCEACKENWLCSAWTGCIDNMQTRTCEDDNGCGTTTDKPIEQRSCAKCIENWKCDWTDCVLERTREYTYPTNCTDINNCGTEIIKPGKTSCEGKICLSKWSCKGWSECKATYDLKEIAEGKERFTGTQERICVDLRGCHASVIEKKICNLNAQIRAEKVRWCEQEYVEIKEKDTDKLVSRVKTADLTSVNLTSVRKVNIGFVISNFTGYCDYCYDEEQDYDETGTDCGGPNCPECVNIIERFDWMKLISLALWILVLILLLIYLIYLYRSGKKYEIRREEKRKLKLLKKIERLEREKREDMEEEAEEL